MDFETAVAVVTGASTVCGLACASNNKSSTLPRLSGIFAAVTGGAALICLSDVFGLGEFQILLSHATMLTLVPVSIASSAFQPALFTKAADSKRRNLKRQSIPNKKGRFDGVLFKFFIFVRRITLYLLPQERHRLLLFRLRRLRQKLQHLQRLRRLLLQLSLQRRHAAQQLSLM